MNNYYELKETLQYVDEADILYFNRLKLYMAAIKYDVDINDEINWYKEVYKNNREALKDLLEDKGSRLNQAIEEVEYILELMESDLYIELDYMKNLIEEPYKKCEFILYKLYQVKDILRHIAYTGEVI